MLAEDRLSTEKKTLMLGALAGIIYTLVSTFLASYEINTVYLRVVYFASILIIPMILWCMRQNSGWELVFTVNVFTLFFLVLAAVTRPNIELFITIDILYFAILILLFVFHFYQRPSYKPWHNSIIALTLILYVGCALTYPFAKNFLEDISFFSVGKRIFCYAVLIAGAAFFAWIFLSSKIKNCQAKERWTLWVCLLSPFLLFDVQNLFDIEHYNAYLAPAIAVLHGQIPLIDVFCHYGLCYLVFTVAFLILPNTYASASLVVCLLNIASWMSLLLIFRKLIRNPFYFTVLALTTLLGMVYMLGNSPNVVPSVLSLRYFPTFLLAYFLFTWLDRPIPRMGFVLLVFLNALWSLETLLAMIILVGAYYWLKTESWSVFFKSIAKLLSCIALIFIIFSLSYLIFFRQLPNFELYLSYIAAYLNPYTRIGARFLMISTSFYNSFVLWILVAVVNVVIFYQFIVNRLYHQPIQMYWKKIQFVNILSMICTVYIVLQPAMFTVMTIGLPSFMVLYAIVVTAKERSDFFVFRHTAAILLTFFAFFYFAIFVKNIFMNHGNYYRNGDLLYTIFHPRGFTPARYWANLTQFCSQKYNSPEAGASLMVKENTCQRNSYHQELFDAIQKWYPNQKEILLFHRDLVELLLEHHKVHQVLVNPINDNLLPSLDTQILASIQHKVKPGDIVMVEKNLNILPMDYQVLLKINQQYDMKLRDETPHLKVFQLMEKKPGQKSDFSPPLNIPSVKMPFSPYAEFSGDEIKVGIRALFDMDKETTWYAQKEILFDNKIPWLLLDLGEPWLVNDLRIWRRIDFRVPESRDSSVFHFIENFNIEISLDKQKWHLLTSVENFVLGQNDFYDGPISPPQLARYIRINFYAGNLPSFSISEVEVFGERPTQ